MQCIDELFAIPKILVDLNRRRVAFGKPRCHTFWESRIHWSVNGEAYLYGLGGTASLIEDTAIQKIGSTRIIDLRIDRRHVQTDKKWPREALGFYYC